MTSMEWQRPPKRIWQAAEITRTGTVGKSLVMTPRGINANGFYGIAPMHIHPYATKVCTKVILDTFYTVQDFGTATGRTYPIINVRLHAYYPQRRE